MKPSFSVPVIRRTSISGTRSRWRMRGSGCCGCCGWGRRRYFEQRVDGGPECIKGQSADHGFLHTQQLTVGPEGADDKRRCAADLHALRLSDTALNVGGEFVAGHAVLDVDTESLGAGVDVAGVQRGRFGKQAVVHFPELALLRCTSGGPGG